MKRLAPAILAAAAVLLLACQPSGDSLTAGAASRSGESTAVRVDRVVDGDTLVVRLTDGRRRRVRLIGIDTPETKRPGAQVECGGPQASALMARLALKGQGRRASGRDVVLVADRSQDSQDRYGRTLAYVDRADRRDIGRALIEAGWAQSVAFDGRFARQSQYDAAESAARRDKRGIWGLCR